MSIAGKDFKFRSADGRLELYGREQGSPDAVLTVFCMGGLTRNSLDFTELAKHLSRYRVISVDQRGRGRSDWDPEPANYTPLIQAGDMFALLDELAIERVALIGTSNGGLMAMLMGAMQPERVAGMILNDIGPELPTAGLKRIGISLTGLGPAQTWSDAARLAKQVNGIAIPNYAEADWDAFARRTYLEDASGIPVAAYDPALIRGLNELDLDHPLPDLWPLWPSLAEIPILAIRGATSDILTKEILEAMAARHPQTQTVEVPQRGHAPMLDEPVALAAIESFLSRLE